MASAAGIVAEARSWISTPVRFKGRTKGVSVDCLGLILAAGFVAGDLIIPREDLRQLERAYGWLPDSERLQTALNHYLVRVEGDFQPGDVGAFDWGQPAAPMHLAIMAELDHRPTMIHANPLTTPKRVTETTYAAVWPVRLCGFWRFPGLV